MRGTKRYLWTAALLLAATTAMAGGFNIYEAGAKATALGGAFTATADDGSAVFYNPAGLAFQEGSGFDLNLMPIVPTAEFTGAQIGANEPFAGKTADQMFPIPGAYYYKNTGDLTYGIGLYAPFGMGVKWSDPETWVGRFESHNVQLKTVYVTPCVAWKVSETVAVSVGVDVAYSHLELNRYNPTYFGGDVTEINAVAATIDGSADLNYTPSAGALIQATDKLSFGVMYHHQKTMAVNDGKMTLVNNVPDTMGDLQAGVTAQLMELGVDANDAGEYVYNGTAELKLPHMLALGVAYQVNEKLRVEGNMVHFGWSHFDELALDFEVDALDTVIREDYEDVWQYRAGITYAVNDELTALAGYVKDSTPQPVESMSPLLPDASRDDYSFGLAYELNEKITLTGTYMSVNFKERSNVVDGEHVSYDTHTNPAGSYDSVANIFGVGIGYRF